MTWLDRNASAIGAVSAALTALTALLALAGISLQLSAADRISRAQSAREAYAAHLALAVAQPRFADPGDACALLASDEGAAYEAFVDHLLYSAEQMLTTEAGWNATFFVALEPHAAYLCAEVAPEGETEELAGVLAAFRASTCPGLPPCPG